MPWLHLTITSNSSEELQYLVGQEGARLVPGTACHTNARLVHVDPATTHNASEFSNLPGHHGKKTTVSIRDRKNTNKVKQQYCNQGDFCH